MTTNPIILIWGEPNSVFSEIFLKTIKKYNNKKPIIFLGSKKLILAQLKKLKFKYNFNEIKLKKLKFEKSKLKKINIININYKFDKPFEKISYKANRYIEDCFELAFKIIKNNKIAGVINGPISKKTFLKNKFLGVTEYLAKSFNVKDNYAMLIFNRALSVLPITTHLPINKITKFVDKKSIIKKTTLLNKFFINYMKKKPKIAICGLNPHCENFFNTSEEIKFIRPAVNLLKKKKINISGPFPSDTIFLEQNRKKYDVIIGIYHDQVLGPIKALQGFNAINITLGLPILRISPDHGPNFKMIGKNKSNPQSLIESIKFLDSKC